MTEMDDGIVTSETLSASRLYNEGFLWMCPGGTFDTFVLLFIKINLFNHLIWLLKDHTLCIFCLYMYKNRYFRSIFQLLRNFTLVIKTTITKYKICYFLNIPLVTVKFPQFLNCKSRIVKQIIVNIIQSSVFAVWILIELF